MNKIKLLVGSLLVVVLLIASYAILLYARQGTKVNEVWETTNKTFKIRIIAYAEKGIFIAGARYVFQSADVGSDSWREILTVRHDDPVEIPREQVRFVNDQIGYAFMGYKYAVTVTGGATWSVWDAIVDLPDWQRTRAVIKEARLEPDGTGTMSLISSTNQVAPELRTKDYGRHWKIE